MLDRIQPGILKPPPAVARSLTFRIDKAERIAPALRRLAAEFPSDCAIFSVGKPCALALGARVPGLRTFTAISGPGCVVPSTQDALWLRLCGPDRGAVFDGAREVRRVLSDAFRLADTLD